MATRTSHTPKTKPDTILKLLQRAKGASMPALQKATGWQPHSIRAALTGLRKKGHAIKHSKDAKGVTIYQRSEEASS